MIRRLLIQIVALALATLSLLALSTELASAHYKVDSKRWWFRGYTAAEDDGTYPLDPINVFFYRGGRITGDRLDNHVSAHANLRIRYLNGGQKECKGGSQYLTFVNYDSDRKQGAAAKDIDEVDRPRETGCGPGLRYHLRFWDDLEHDRGTIDHRVKDWGPANIHQDRVAKGGGDTLVPSFDRAEKWLRGKMRAHCQKKRWRVMPGAQDLPRTSPSGDAQNRANDGFLSLITMAHTSSPGQCPGSSGPPNG